MTSSLGPPAPVGAMSTPSAPLFLDAMAVDRHLTMEMSLEAVAEAFRAVSTGGAIQPVRTHLHLPEQRGQFLVMPGHLASPPALGAKLLTLVPGNEARGLPSHQSLIVLFHPETGMLRALVDGDGITAARTGAASAVATRCLAWSDASELALLGAGLQARSHLEAMLAVRPIRRVRIWSRTRARVEAFLAWGKAWLEAKTARGQLSESVELVAAPTPAEAVRGAQVICTLTASSTPILMGEWLEPGVHVNAVGAHTPATRELDSEAVAVSRCFVDQREAALAEAGEFRIPMDEGRIDEGHLLGEIGQLLRGEVDGRTGPDDRTLFKSLGLAAQDLATAVRLVERVEAGG
jgi:ornithine cyclodeaminase/alanine dehydrogenase-like protein (mu-crystallin family)